VTAGTFPVGPTLARLARCRSAAPWLTLLLLGLGLAGCGDYPRPFAGNAGAGAALLSQPPPARLAIPDPLHAGLDAAAASALAQALAKGLLAEEVPVVAAPAHKGDWRLDVAADPRGGEVVPLYRVIDPAGEQRGETEGLPVASGLWQGGPDTAQVAAAAVPRISALLSRIEAAQRQSDPNSLVNRTPRLLFRGVSSAPGDGDTSLTKAMKVALVKVGVELTETDKGADFRLDGRVAVAPGSPGKQRVEIQWVVSDAKGDEAGRVVQLNEVPKGMLDLYWGDVAYAVAREAAGGVHDVIVNRIAGRKP
jgi:hypothetical protein